MDIKGIFSERLLKLRKDRALSRQKAADDIGVSRACLEYYEKGERVPGFEILSSIAEYYNVSSDYLLGRTDIKSTDMNLQKACEYIGISQKSGENLCFISQSGWSANILLETEHFGALVRKLTSIDEWTSKLNYFNQVILPSLGVDETIYKRINAKPETELESIHDILNNEFLKIVKEHIGGEDVGGKNIPYRGLEYEEKIDLYEFKLDKDIKAIVEDIKAAHKMDDTIFDIYNKFICDTLREYQKKIKELLQDHKSGTEAQKYKAQLEAINAFLTKHNKVALKKGADDNG